MTLDEFMSYVDDNNVSVGAYIYDKGRLRRGTYFEGHDYDFRDSEVYQKIKDMEVINVGSDLDYLCIDLHVRDK